MKRQIGIIKPRKPVRFADGTGSGTVGDAPQLQYIDPNSTQVQYNAPTQMSLDDAKAAMQKLYGPGQDYSDVLGQIGQLQGNLKPVSMGQHLQDFGARLMAGGNFGEAALGARQDDQAVASNNFANTIALMKMKQAIQAEQAQRADQIAGRSDSYAQQQNQDAVNAAKMQYGVNKANADAKVGIQQDNNRITQTQQGMDQAATQAMASAPYVSTLLSKVQGQLATETDPAKRAALQQTAGQLQNRLGQIKDLEQQQLDMKLKSQEANEDHTFAHQKELAEINAANQQKLFGMKQGMRADGTFDPEYIKAIANYDLDPPSNRDPAYKFVMAQVHQVNGDYRPEQMAVIKKARLGFTTGSQGDSARQLNNVIQHADLVYQMNDALHNGSFKPGTDIYNRILNTFGSDAVSNPTIALHYLSSEAGKSLAGRSGGTQDERKAVSDLANMQSGSYQAIKGALGTTIRLVGSQARNLNEQYRQAVGPTRAGDKFSVIYPESKDVLSRHGFDPETMMPVSQTAAPGKGNGQKLDQSTAMKYFQMANGDRAKARQMAQSDGWKF